MALELRWKVDGAGLELGNTNALIADDDERVYVLDGMADQIVVVDRNGTRIMTIGAPGEGPGEFRNLSGIAWLGDDILALDNRQFRFTLFDTNGAIISSRRWERPFTIAGTPPLLSNGNSAFARVEHVDAGPGSEIDEYLIVEADGSIEPVEAVPEPATSVGGLACSPPGSDGFLGIDLPFFDRGPLRAFLPGGAIAVAHRDTFLIQVFDVRSQAVMREVRTNYEPLELTDADWAMQPEVQNYEALDREHGGLLERDRPDPCPYHDHRPATWPVLRTLVSDEAGRLWVEATARSKRGHTLILFDASGEPIGQAAMPDRDPLVTPYARGNLLYLVTVDDLGVQSIEVYEADMPAS